MSRSSPSILIACVAAICAATAPAAAAPRRLAVAFDQRTPMPGVRLLELSQGADGSWSGQLTSDWYGSMPMSNVAVSDDGADIAFDIRNINTKDVPFRRWTARRTASGIRLTGQIWESAVDQTGHDATPAEIAALVHHDVPLPPLGILPDDGLARTPPMGWSSWNKFADRIDDATVRAMADAMVATGLRDAGYRYVNIDDGWQGQRDAKGVLQPNAKFPDMRALADYVHAKGLKLGLYTSPGLRTCAGYEGSYGHVAQDARTFADWGVDYVKYDLCSGEWQYDDADKVKRAYHEMGVALRATGRPIIFSLCEYGRFDVASWGRSVGGHLWRTTGDITDDYKTMSDIGFGRNPKFPHDGPGGWNDPDMLEIGNGGMTVDEYRTHMTLWAMQAAPLIMGHDLRQTSQSSKKLLENREVIAIDQDALGIQGRAVRTDGEQEIWRKELAGGGYAVALFNRSARPATMPLPGDLTGGSLRDVWGERNLPASSRVVTIPAHGVVLLRTKAPPSR